MAEVADRIGCEGETSSFYSCAMEQDVCDPSGNQLDACESEFADVLSCTLDYCSDNPSDEVCGFPESGGDPPEG